LRRHAEPIQLTATGRHADHDRQFWLGRTLLPASRNTSSISSKFVSGFAASTAEIASVILVAFARSLSDEKGVSLVESNRHDGEDGTGGWETLGLAAADGSGSASAI
jgi:hypothetical protein